MHPSFSPRIRVKSRQSPTVKNSLRDGGDHLACVSFTLFSCRLSSRCRSMQQVRSCRKSVPMDMLILGNSPASARSFPLPWRSSSPLKRWVRCPLLVSRWLLRADCQQRYGNGIGSLVHWINSVFVGNTGDRLCSLRGLDVVVSTLPQFGKLSYKGFFAWCCTQRPVMPRLSWTGYRGAYDCAQQQRAVEPFPWVQVQVSRDLRYSSSSL